MRRAFAICSVVFHAVLITAILVTQLFAVGALPAPHRPLAFETPAFIRTVDIPLPAPERPRTPAPADRSGVSENAAPVVAPATVTPETGREGPSARAADVGDVTIGTGGPIGFAMGQPSPPPPPPPLAPQPVAPVHLHSGMTPPAKTVDVSPRYPPVAQSARIEGVVILETVIDVQGRVESARVLRSVPLLDQAALDAVRQWRFTPARLNGEAVPVVMTVTVNFTLKDR
jgi:protein TonB